MGSLEHLALDHGRGRGLLLFGRGKISELMGDMAQGIKAFKKGMSEDEKAEAEAKPEPMKTIDHQARPDRSGQRPRAENRARRV